MYADPSGAPFVERRGVPSSRDPDTFKETLIFIQVPEATEYTKKEVKHLVEEFQARAGSSKILIEYLVF